MSKPVSHPTRLSCLSETEDSLGVGRMFRNARELPDEELPRLRWRLRTSQRLRAMRPRLFLRVALVVGLVFCMGGVVGAMVSPFWAKRQQPVVAARRPPAPAPLPSRKPRPVTSPSVMPALVDPVPVETPPAGAEPSTVPDQPQPVPASAKHRPPSRVAILTPPGPVPGAALIVAPPAVAPPAVTPSSIAVEQTLLGKALRSLREGRDPRTALDLLAQHAEHFPKGALASEATMLRIETLLSLGRRDDALAFLDKLPLASLPNRDEQFVVRGELRAANGRWREAKQDFDQALEVSLPAASAKARDRQERALWGRAAARSRLGDQDGARADLELILRWFPGGRFAGPAASLLNGLP
jgi:hypothetical protein